MICSLARARSLPRSLARSLSQACIAHDRMDEAGKYADKISDMTRKAGVSRCVCVCLCVGVGKYADKISDMTRKAGDALFPHALLEQQNMNKLAFHEQTQQVIYAQLRVRSHHLVLMLRILACTNAWHTSLYASRLLMPTSFYLCPAHHYPPHRALPPHRSI